MMQYPQTLLLDTNVWIENYVGERGELVESRELIDYCLSHEINLLVSITALKDVYYNIGRYLKAKARNEGAEVTESFAAAVEQLAWSSVLNLTELATTIPADLSDFWTARCFHELHRDLEDDLLLAAAQRAQADYLVTSDKRLLSKTLVPTLSPTDMLTLLKTAA